jgi:hypothetical protein
MVALLLTTTISCLDGIALIQRVSKTFNLTHHQKIELIQVIRETIPTCPLKVVPDGKPKQR